jgi:hypothetical protein
MAFEKRLGPNDFCVWRSRQKIRNFLQVQRQIFICLGLYTEYSHTAYNLHFLPVENLSFFAAVKNVKNKLEKWTIRGT